MKTLLALGLFATSPLWAAPMLERLCFNSTTEAQKAIPILNFVLVKGQDQVSPEGQCLNVSLDSTRGELFQRWVRTRLPNAQYSFSTLDAPAPECDMRVRKITTKNEQNTEGQIVFRGGVQVSAGEGITDSTEESILKVTSGNRAKLTVDQSQLEITCTVRPSGTYQLKFSLLFLPRTPFVPQNLPPGTTVVINSPPPPDQSGTSLSTEVEARPGESINLGSITKDLNSKRHDANVPNGASGEIKTGSETSQWFLIIK